MSDKKLIIDEDWKSQVQAEKEAQSSASQDSGRGASTQQPDETASEGEFPMPPASLELLVTTLATEALVALGKVPHPATGELQAHRSQAQYLIDTIDVLRQKTKGNLTPGEEHMIRGTLHELRMIFLATAPADA